MSAFDEIVLRSATVSPPIVLFELHGHSIEEIAEIQRTSISSVKSRLTRGRERPGNKKERVPGQEGSHDQPRLREHDEEEQEVDPPAIGRQETL